ncbi:MAG: hypothetical protein GY759_12880 [Chloroflexi bacterium]|nr:hypothetical protein [Chloroflexota bacterium]
MICDFCGAQAPKADLAENERDQQDRLYDLLVSVDEDKKRVTIIRDAPLPTHPNVIIDAGSRLCELLEDEGGYGDFQVVLRKRIRTMADLLRRLPQSGIRSDAISRLSKAIDEHAEEATRDSKTDLIIGVTGLVVVLIVIAGLIWTIFF